MWPFKKKEPKIEQAVIEKPRLNETDIFSEAFERILSELQKEYEASGMDYISAQKKARFLADFERQVDKTFRKIKKNS